MRTTGSQLLLRSLRRKGFNLRDIVLIGDRKRVAQFSAVIQREARSGYRIIDLPGQDDNIFSAVDDTRFDEAFVLMGSHSPKLDSFVLRLVKQGKRVHFVPGFFDAKQFRQSLSEFAGIPILSLGGYSLSPTQTIAKRLFDIVGAVFLLVVLSPVLAIVALMVKVSSPGPAVFAQERICERGRKFRIYKFRTMYQNAEEILRSDPSLHKMYIDNGFKLPKGQDPRITTLGKVLRTTSLDELPQLFNVLCGHMSLVGPRPLVPPEIDMYGDYANLFMSVKPGLTGNWQISGRSEINDYLRRAVLDVEYIRDQSLKHDVDILLKTIPAVLMRKGAH
jgi:exopolysaccharide biosynthesis polyprenyl glycosylphosphotransferase